MFTFTAFILWLHLAALAVWIGGLFAVSFVLAPLARTRVSSASEGGRLVAHTIQRFQRISREVVLLILLTGLFNVINAGMARGFEFGGPYMRTLFLKVGLFVAVVVIQGWQSFRLAPRFAAITEETPAEVAKRYDRRLLVSSLASLLLAVIAILLGVRLRTGG